MSIMTNLEKFTKSQEGYTLLKEIQESLIDCKIKDVWFEIGTECLEIHFKLLNENGDISEDFYLIPWADGTVLEYDEYWQEAFKIKANKQDIIDDHDRILKKKE